MGHGHWALKLGASHELVDEDVVAGLPLPATVAAGGNHETARRVYVEVAEDAAVVAGDNGEGDPGDLPRGGGGGGWGCRRGVVQTQVVEPDVVLAAAEKVVPVGQGADTADAAGSARELEQRADLGREADVVLLDGGVSAADEDGVAVDGPGCRHAPRRGAGRNGDLFDVVGPWGDPRVPDVDGAVDGGGKEDVVGDPLALVGACLERLPLQLEDVSADLRFLRGGLLFWLEAGLVGSLLLCRVAFVPPVLVCAVVVVVIVKKRTHVIVVVVVVVVIIVVVVVCRLPVQVGADRGPVLQRRDLPRGAVEAVHVLTRVEVPLEDLPVPRAAEEVRLLCVGDDARDRVRVVVLLVRARDGLVVGVLEVPLDGPLRGAHRLERDGAVL